MEYSHEFDDKNDILTVRPKGEVMSVKDYEQNATYSFRLMKKFKTDKIIFDQRCCPDTGEAFNNYNFAKDFPRLGYKPNYKIALLISPDSKEIEIEKFFETAALNRGIQMKVTTLEKEAKEWLLKE